MVWLARILSAIVLLVVGGIHLYLVFDWADGWLGVMFVLNAIAGVVLAAGMLLLRGRLLLLTAWLSLLFVVVTLGALFISLTVGLFNVRETWQSPLVTETVIVESIGIVVLAATAFLLRGQREVARSRGDREAHGGVGPR